MFEDMKNKDIRRANLMVLIKRFDTVKDFAEAAKMDDSYVSQLKTGYGMGDKTARKIEVAFKKPDGWMDVPHAINEETQVYLTTNNAEPPIDIDQLGLPAEAALRLMRLVDEGIGFERLNAYPESEKKRIIMALQSIILDKESEGLSDNFILKMIGTK